ncbi:MAG: hypothetical protein ACXWAT_05165, partial [Methylobacter sp.]
RDSGRYLRQIQNQPIEYLKTVQLEDAIFKIRRVWQHFWVVLKCSKQRTISLDKFTTKLIRRHYEF